MDTLSIGVIQHESQQTRFSQLKLKVKSERRKMLNLTAQIGAHTASKKKQSPDMYFHGHVTTSDDDEKR